jgi:hypothetical protein
MSPALRSNGKGHLSRRITLMVLPFEHVSQPDATGDSSSDIDNHFHSDIGLEPHPHLNRVANTPAADRLSDSPAMRKSSSCS